jgi:hypothetical protein
LGVILNMPMSALCASQASISPSSNETAPRDRTSSACPPVASCTTWRPGITYQRKRKRDFRSSRPAAWARSLSFNPGPAHDSDRAGSWPGATADCCASISDLRRPAISGRDPFR